ncbi:hypothetical protein GcC1_011015, partial [Golovinomyces cichoracearum]
GGEHLKAFGAESTPPKHSSRCIDPPLDHRTIKKIVNKAVAERDTFGGKVIRRLGGAYLTKTVKLKLAEVREKGYLEAFNSENNEMKRGQLFTKELREEERVSVLFSSLSRVQKAIELQDAKEAAK